jgi:hypothetical protein
MGSIAPPPRIQISKQLCNLWSVHWLSADEIIFVISTNISRELVDEI